MSPPDCDRLRFAEELAKAAEERADQTLARLYDIRKRLIALELRAAALTEAIPFDRLKDSRA